MCGLACNAKDNCNMLRYDDVNGECIIGEFLFSYLLNKNKPHDEVLGAAQLREHDLELSVCLSIHQSDFYLSPFICHAFTL